MAKFKISTASYLIFKKEDKYLLLRRFNTGWQDGMYSLVAGHVEEGETPTQCVIREAQEEAGVVVKGEDLFCTTVMHRQADADTYVDFFFICSGWDGEIENKEAHKCDDLSWFGRDEIPENTLPYIKEAIQSVADEKHYLEVL